MDDSKPKLRDVSDDDRMLESDLVERFRTGDCEAFSRVFALYRPRVLAFIQKRMRNPSEVEDIMHETFLQAFRARREFEGRSSLLTWLLGIARFMCLRSMRNDRRWMTGARAVLYEVDPGFDPKVDERVDSMLALGRCDELLQKHRNERDREIFGMYYLEGMTTREIADRCGKTPDVVKTSLSRTRSVLKRHLGTVRPAA